MVAVHLGRMAWQVACNSIFWILVIFFLFYLVYFQASPSSAPGQSKPSTIILSSILDAGRSSISALELRSCDHSLVACSGAPSRKHKTRSLLCASAELRQLRCGQGLEDMEGVLAGSCRASILLQAGGEHENCGTWYYCCACT